MTHRSQQDRFLAFLEDHKKILHKVSGAYSRRPEDRQDLIQEIVFHLWRSFDHFDDRYRFSTWMYRIAMNVAISFYRSENRRARRTVLADEPTLEVAALDRAPEDSSDDIRRLHQFIGRLDDFDKALMLLYLEAHPYETIAEILGISTTNVATKISRIKRTLRRDFGRA